MTAETDDIRYMRLALAEARRAAELGEVPIGAVVVSPSGAVLGRGHNLTERLADVTAHAEMQAITAAADHLNGKYLPDCTLYVTLEPCPMCAAALRWAQIGRVVYGASDPKRGYRAAYADPAAALHPRTLVASGLLADDALHLLRTFFRRRR